MAVASTWAFTEAFGYSFGFMLGNRRLVEYNIIVDRIELLKRKSDSCLGSVTLELRFSIVRTQNTHTIPSNENREAWSSESSSCLTASGCTDSSKDVTNAIMQNQYRYLFFEKPK